MSKLKPNFTQTPNIFFDEIMSELGHAETKCLLYIFRRTYGFQKESDEISLTQFETGMKNKEGEVLDKGTGLKRNNIYKALESLSERGIVLINKSGSINRYSLDLGYEKDLGTENTHTRYVKEPELGTQSNIQKKEKESIQKKEEILPEWLNKKSWKEWVDYRKEIKKALKPSTEKKQLSFLEKNKSDHVQIINNSIQNGWTGLFELKGGSFKKANLLNTQSDKYKNLNVIKG
jgi:DNA-binding transcriptional ArsR family regulator